jgi:hypothetical protein
LLLEFLLALTKQGEAPVSGNLKSIRCASGKADVWEKQQKTSYDVEELRKEYRERLFSDEGLKLVEHQGARGNGVQEQQKSRLAPPGEEPAV